MAEDQAADTDIGPRAPTEGELIFMQADAHMAAVDPLCPAGKVVATYEALEAGRQAMDRVTPEHMVASEDYTPRGTSMWADTPGRTAAVEQMAFGVAAQYAVAAAELDELEAEL